MSMNFNSGPPAALPPIPKKNNTGIILAVVIGAIAATTVIFGVISAQDTVKSFSSSPEPIQSQTNNDASNLEQKLFEKCKNLEDWYKSLDGFESTNYHCDKYAKGWAGLVK